MSLVYTIPSRASAWGAIRRAAREPLITYSAVKPLECELDRIEPSRSQG